MEKIAVIIQKFEPYGFEQCVQKKQMEWQTV